MIWARLELTERDAEWLQATLLNAAQTGGCEIKTTVADSYGQRAMIDDAALATETR